MRRWATPSRATIWFLALFAGYLVAIGMLDLISASTVLAAVVTGVFFCLLMLLRPPRHWLDWVEYVIMLVVGVLWIAELGLILLERRVRRG